MLNREGADGWEAVGMTALGDGSVRGPAEAPDCGNPVARWIERLIRSSRRPVGAGDVLVG